jgi:hypothetical protein
MNEDIERERLNLEKRRLELEIEKERNFKKIEYLKAAAIFIPLVLVFLTFAFNNYSTNLDHRYELDIKRIEANNSFRLKAAEIVMNAESPNASYNRAKALRGLFPEYLSSDFAEKFDPYNTGTPKKWDLATLIIEHPSQKNDIIDLWIGVYPGDEEWAKQWKTNYNITWSSGSGKRTSSNKRVSSTWEGF